MEQGTKLEQCWCRATKSFVDVILCCARHLARVCLLAFLDDGTRDPTSGVFVSQSILDKSSDVLCLISMNMENESENLVIVFYAL